MGSLGILGFPIVIRPAKPGHSKLEDFCFLTRHRKSGPSTLENFSSGVVDVFSLCGHLELT